MKVEKTKVKLSHKMWAKVGAYFLLTGAAAVLLLCAAGVMFLQSFDMYTQPLDTVKTNAMRQAVYSAADDLIFWISNGNEVNAQTIAGSSNAEFELIDYTDNMALPLWKSADYDPVSSAEGSLRLSMAFVTAEDGGGSHYCYAYRLDSLDQITSESTARMREEGERLILVNAAIDPDYPIPDQYRLIDRGLDAAYSLRYGVYFLALAALILLVLCFVFILCGAGHRAEREDLVPGPFTGIPLDLLTAGLVFLVIAAVFMGDALGADIAALYLYTAVLLVAAVPVFTGWYASLALRVKLGTWWRNTVIFRLLCLCWKAVKWLFRGVRRLGRGLGALVKGIPLVWKTAVGTAALCFIEFLFIMFTWYEPDNLLFWWIVEKLLLIPAVLYSALVLRRLQAGGRALAQGDLSYQINDRHMLWDFKEHAENLNSISLGMTRAVDERMKSERFKTELITNVSHDIRTPLTSIINYSDLIGREKCENEKIGEYAEVLHRQSERLKKLLDDLLEASKASTGNVEVHPAPCEAEVLLTQAAGEYEQRLRDCGLELIVKQPAGGLRIMADGRHIARVFDNLMSNICKYSQTGTRVYLSLEEQAGKAVFTFKNTSRYALDLSSEELMERFVRGDKSRSTEGSGLGLSIARSLTELQGGALEISVDGDLFKATLRFDKI